MSQTMTRTQIYIEPDVLAQAKFKAQSQGFNLSQYLRNLLKEDINAPETTQKQKRTPLQTFTPKDKTIRNYSGNHNIIYDYKL